MSSLPLLLFGTVSFIGGVLSLFLPETLGKKLPDTVIIRFIVHILVFLNIFYFQVEEAEH